jgi:hypothetical protein
MERAAERFSCLGTGPLVALLPGVALVPLRGVTAASNLTFVILALAAVAGVIAALLAEAERRR